MTPYVPAEWALQNAVWLTWPCNAQWWKNASAQAAASFATLAATISRFEKVRINCAQGSIEAAKLALAAHGGCDVSNIEFHPVETDDVWCRDSGAIFRINNGALEALDFDYNAWGGKFPPWDRDNALASKMAEFARARRVKVDLTCEGGGLEFDGGGTLMTTECVVLNPNRNPDITKARAEEILKDACGVSNIVWLADGLFNDDTDGHIDNLARFAPNNIILAASCEESNPSRRQLAENFEILKSARNARGEKYEVIELPVPAEPIFAKYYDGGERRLPASYANYLAVNGAIIVPTYAQKGDQLAMEIIGDAFPDREIVGVDSRVFLLEGGAVHCLTQQQPAV